MALGTAQYRTIDPQATGPGAVRAAFENQVAYCRDNGAPRTAMVCQALLELLDSNVDGATLGRIRRWTGAPLADALPLRIAGGLHALHLSGRAPGLAPLYGGVETPDYRDRVAAAVAAHDAGLALWLEGPPQTNEAGRSWAYAAAMLWLTAQGCPAEFALYELGSSAGINLMMDRYRYDLGGVVVGPTDARMRIHPEWRGDPPPAARWRLIAARGCDVAPVDLCDPAQALRLRAYIWPEATERFARMDAAVAEAWDAPPDIARLAAGEFVAQVLSAIPRPGVTRMIAHSVVWQYISAEERRGITQAIETAGATAQPESPLAWVMLEANRDTHRHELTVRWWPGGPDAVHLGVAHPHGAWVEWTG